MAAGAVLVASTAGKLPTLESFWVRPKIPKLAPNAMTAAVAAAVTAPAVAIALRRCMRISLLCPPFARYAAARQPQATGLPRFGKGCDARSGGHESVVACWS